MPTISPADARNGGLLLYLALAYALYAASGAIPSRDRPGRRAPARVLADKGAFALVFAILPLGVFALLGARLPGLEYLYAGDPRAWAMPAAALALVAYAAGRLGPMDKADLANYPQYLPARWGPGELLAEGLSWLLYLSAYEFVFRGMLLSVLMPAGALAAAAASTALYAFAHLPKGNKEALGCLVFGVAASALTLRFGSVLPAALVHTALALGNDRNAFVRLSGGS